MKKLNALILYHVEYEQPRGYDADQRTISYALGWPKYFAQHSKFNCELINIAKKSDCWKLLTGQFSKQTDCIVILHSCFANAQLLRRLNLWKVKKLKFFKAYFMGNEYKHMPQKMKFCEEVGVDLLISMNYDDPILDLYKNRLDCRVESITSAGLDPEVFRPEVPFYDRSVDLGFRAADEPLYFGHQRRVDLMNYFMSIKSEPSLKLDFSMNGKDRFTVSQYNHFLNTCRGQIGSPGGSDYYDIEDHARNLIIKAEHENPNLTVEEAKALLDAHCERRVWANVSGRQSEAAGTKSVMLLYEGDYSGFFEPDVHYIPVSKNYDNTNEVLEKFRDDEYCKRITENAYDVAMTKLTYTKLIDEFYDHVTSMLN